MDGHPKKKKKFHHHILMLTLPSSHSRQKFDFYLCLFLIKSITIPFRTKKKKKKTVQVNPICWINSVIIKGQNGSSGLSQVCYPWEGQGYRVQAIEKCQVYMDQVREEFTFYFPAFLLHALEVVVFFINIFRTYVNICCLCLTTKKKL